jgi:hypothetical protein
MEHNLWFSASKGVSQRNGYQARLLNPLQKLLHKQGETRTAQIW